MRLRRGFSTPGLRGPDGLCTMPYTYLKPYSKVCVVRCAGDYILVVCACASSSNTSTFCIILMAELTVQPDWRHFATSQFLWDPWEHSAQRGWCGCWKWAIPGRGRGSRGDADLEKYQKQDPGSVAAGGAAREAHEQRSTAAGRQSPWNMQTLKLVRTIAALGAGKFWCGFDTKSLKGWH